MQGWAAHMEQTDLSKILVCSWFLQGKGGVTDTETLCHPAQEELSLPHWMAGCEHVFCSVAFLRKYLVRKMLEEISWSTNQQIKIKLEIQLTAALLCIMYNTF